MKFFGWIMSTEYPVDCVENMSYHMLTISRDTLDNKHEFIQADVQLDAHRREGDGLLLPCCLIPLGV